jgi:O-antigen/teichoic acid export membrane protein
VMLLHAWVSLSRPQSVTICMESMSLTINTSRRAVRETPLLQASFLLGERLIFLLQQATTIILVTRLLGDEFFGKYALVLAWAAVFQGVAHFGITECLAREVGREPGLASRYFGHSLVLSSSLSVIAMAIMGLAAWAAHYPSDVTLAIFLATGTLLPTNVTATCRGVLLASQKIEYTLGVGLAESLILLPCNIYWIVTGAGLLPIIGTVVLAKTVAGLLALRLVHGSVTPVSGPLQWTLLRQLWRTLLPFGVGNLIVFPSIRFDIFLLSKMATFEILGTYLAATKLMEFLFVLPMAFFMVMLPRTAQDFSSLSERRTEHLERSLTWYFALVIPVGVGVIGFAEPIIFLVYGNAFAGTIPLLRLLMIAFLLFTMDVILAMICKAAGFQQVDLVFALTSTVLNLFLNVLLIPGLLAVGTALAVSLSLLVGLVLRWHFVTRSVVLLPWLVLLRVPVATAVLLITLCLVFKSLIPWPVSAIGYGLGVGALVLTQFRRTSIRGKAALG